MLRNDGKRPCRIARTLMPAEHQSASRLIDSAQRKNAKIAANSDKLGSNCASIG
jgi:hypothetical protein